MKKIFFLTLCLFVINQCFTQTLIVTGGWTSTLASTSITEAGLNYPTADIASAVNQSLIEVNSAKNTVAFVSIQKSDTSWDAGLIILALRTGIGVGSNNFSTTGGTTPLAITNVPQRFFEVSVGSGSSKVSNIPIQYLIRGFTVLMPVRTYTTTIIYTVSN